MSREDDWKIHTLMGNDLTGSGWEWLDDSNTIILRLYSLSGEQIGFDLQSIPHYSTTWEGAGLVMGWMVKSGFEVNVGFYEEWDCQVDCYGTNYRMTADTAPLAICQAYISAMEERK